jgi:hypothetical protein
MFKGLVRHGNGGGSFKIVGWRDLPTGNQSPPPVAGFFCFGKTIWQVLISIHGA